MNLTERRPLASLCLLFGGLASVADAQILRVAPPASEPNGWTAGASVTADGQKVLFSSHASNLVAGDTNGALDYFVYDRGSDVIQFALGTQSVPGQAITDPQLSRDGQSLIFLSAHPFVPGAATGVLNVYAMDQASGAFELLSNGLSGPANGLSIRPSVSSNGRFVTFSSDATNLVANDVNQSHDVFLFDRLMKTIELVSLDEFGAQFVYSNQANWPLSSVSDDGRFVAFEAYLDLTPGQALSKVVYLWDRVAAKSTLLSQVFGNPAIGCYPLISADGTAVVFASVNSGIAPNDNNGGILDVIRYDRASATYELASVTTSGAQTTEACFPTFLSEDGRFLTFTTSAELDPLDNNVFEDMYVRDLKEGRTCIASLGEAGASGNLPSFAGSISLDGRIASFSSQASSLVAMDTNFVSDVFVRDLGVVTSHGTGCQGAGGFTPRVEVFGCVVRDVGIQLELSQGLGGAASIMLVGQGPAQVPIGGGCQLLVGPVFPALLPFALGGLGAGQGSASIPVALSSVLHDTTFALQVFVADPASAVRWSSTQGVSIVVP